ncbi:helix-turn-helix domain-containing protein [Cesiribacter andamanensis]|nr:helix-turn-helix transcriptional regulator [Cesiribacter andamanensis]
MIAQLVKEARQAKGFTQQEVADQTRISLRSIQRIEGGEVEPRTHTLKELARCLDIPLQHLLTTSPEEVQPSVHSISKKIILSLGLSLLVVLLGLAFAAQSPYPETGFEALLGFAGLSALVTLILLRLWPQARRGILTLGFALITPLLALAFVAQAPTFPETGFEALLYMAFLTAFSTSMLLVVWRKKEKESPL